MTHLALCRRPRESGGPFSFLRSGVPAFAGTTLMLALWLPLVAWAQLSIEITGAGAQRIPIAIVPFAGESALAPAISAIVRADLERSGLPRRPSRAHRKRTPSTDEPNQEHVPGKRPWPPGRRRSGSVR